MKAPEIPSNEAARLAELRRYEVLDTADDAAFDVLTQLAARILGVPIALVSLVDADRQWFKSHHGIEATETPRDVSFCGHVVASGAALVVRDARADTRFADNPLVTGGPGVGFYAGVPLRTPAGFVLGTLCTIDHAPREPTAEQLASLELLATAVVAQLEAHRERRQLAAEHQAAEDAAARLQVLFQAMAEGVVVQDESGVILEANPASESILGLTRDQLAGRTSLDPRWRAVHEDGASFPGDEHPSMVTLRTGQACRNVVMGVQKSQDGDLTWISINALPLRAESEPRPRAVITTFHDITQIKLAQLAADRLARKERLVTTGTLAAGVGHEINNPLSFILANLEFALEELRAIAGGSPSARLRELIEVLGETREGAERIRKIVRGLRALAREESEPTATDIEGAVDISIHMAGHELRHKATVSKELGTTPPALADESRLSQVLVNLLVNAAQAFPTGDVEHNRIRVSSAVEPDGRVAIAVSDNGPGIPEALRRRVFDPFFTTKDPGEGTGLGLSICQSIVAALGGELLLQSEAGVGTTFRVLLPVAPLRESSMPAPASIVPLRQGRVLVIDDEPAILSTVRRVLEKDYEVVALSDARVALRRLEAGETFDVVFCDVMMPHLTGEAIYARVRVKNPALADRFVFITGGGDETETEHFLTDVPNERIEKPFSVQNLRGIVRRYVGKE